MMIVRYFPRPIDARLWRRLIPVAPQFPFHICNNI